MKYIFKKIIKWLFLIIPLIFVSFLMHEVFFDTQEKDPIHNKIVSSIANVQNKSLHDTIEIDMKLLVPSKWDTLYVFYATGLEREISQAIGAPSPIHHNVHEGQTLLIFMKGRNVLYHTILTNIPDNDSSGLMKITSYFNPGELFTPNSAKFKVTKSAVDPSVVELLPHENNKSIYRPGFNKNKIKYEDHGTVY